MLQFRVNGQRIERIDDSEPVEKSVNYLYARFDFDGSWRSTGRTALFKTGDTTYKTVLNSFCDNNGGISACAECIVPHEVLNKGSFTVSVYGVRTEDGKGVLITTDSVKIHVRGSGYVPDGSEPTPAELELIQQLQAEIAGFEDSYVIKEAGKGLSEVNFTAAYRNMLLGAVRANAAGTLSEWKDAISGIVAYDHVPLNTSENVIELAPVQQGYEGRFTAADAWHTDVGGGNYVICEYLISITPPTDTAVDFIYNNTAVSIDVADGSLNLLAGHTYRIHLRDGQGVIEDGGL